jgi:minor extracellular serine protease Vpr
VIKFDHWIDGNILFVKADLAEQKPGQYQGSIVVSDKAIQRIPILLRIADGAIEVFENNGKMDFGIDSNEKWSYAKITLYNDDGRLVDSVSITPTKDQSITVGNSGKYWVQAELKTENDTTSVYNTIVVESASNKLVDIDIPYQPLIILGGIVVIIGTIGLLIRRKQN